VELVRSDFDCAGLLAGRATDVDSYGVFDVSLDKERPLPEVCSDPNCASDGDGDGTVDCQDQCPLDATQTTPGVCGCGVPDADLNGDGTIDCVDLCPNDPMKVEPGVCNCGVADADLNGDGTIDCVDLCPNDPMKVEPGVCHCGVADADLNDDGTIDCLDLCPDDPAKIAPGTCGCGVPETVCNNPLLGTYALRALVHVRQRIGTGTPTTSRAISYGLVTISDAGGGAVSVSEQSCWAQTLPNPSETGGTIVYSWSKPAWVQAVPPTVRTATANSDGSWTALGTSDNVGWDLAGQPASCTASATPASGWPSGWGSTCTCNASDQPPYDRDDAPYDCRLTDDDGDGQPGISAYVSTSAPTSPDQDATGLSARAFAAARSLSHWTLSPKADKKHTGTIRDLSKSNLVGCTGIACLGLSTTSPATAPCPEALNPLQLVPVTSAADSCAEIIAQRDTLFSTSTDPSWAAAAACPNP
jgi:hypothetical protein